MAGRVPYKLKSKIPIVSDNPHQQKYSPGMPERPNFLPGHNNDRWGGGGGKKWDGKIPQNHKQPGTLYKTTVNLPTHKDYQDILHWIMYNVEDGNADLEIRFPGDHTPATIKTIAQNLWDWVIKELDDMIDYEIDTNRTLVQFSPEQNTHRPGALTMGLWLEGSQEYLLFDLYHQDNTQLKVFVYTAELPNKKNIPYDPYTKTKFLQRRAVEEPMEKDKKTIVSDFVNTVMMTRRMAKGLNLIEEEKAEKMDVFM